MGWFTSNWHASNWYRSNWAYAGAVVTFPTQYEGLRYWDGAAAIDLCLVAAADYSSGLGAAPEIRGTAQVYAAYLVDTSDPDASPMRIETTIGTKAIRLKT